MSITWLFNKNNNLSFDINIFHLAWNFLCVLFFTAIYFSVLYFILIILYYYMANPCARIGSFSVRIFQRTVSMETVQSVYFWSEAGKFKICNQNSKRKCEHCHSSHWNYQKKLNRFKFFRNFKDGWRSRRFLSASHLECILLSETEGHIINNLLTELPRTVLGNIVRTERSEVRTATTSVLPRARLVNG